MPVSLCEWRVRIGIFLHWSREHEIRERKEKLLKERTRLLKLLRERLSKEKENSEGKEDECDTKTRNSSTGETKDQNEFDVTNNSIPNYTLREKSSPSEYTAEERNTATDFVANGKNSKRNTIFFTFSLILLLVLFLFSFFSGFSFIPDDFLNLLDNNESFLEWEETHSWGYIWLIPVICIRLAYSLLFQLTYTTIKENKTPTQSTTKGDKSPTQTSIKRKKYPTKTIKRGKTQTQTATKACIENKTAQTTIQGDKTQIAIRGDKTQTQTTIKREKSATVTIKGNKASTQTATKAYKGNKPQTQTTIKGDKFNIETKIKGDRTPAQATIKGYKSPTQAKLRVCKGNKSNQTKIKEDESPTQTTMKVDKSLPETTTSGDKTPTKTAIKGNKSPTQTIIKGEKTPTQSMIKGDKSPTKTNSKESKAPAKTTIRGDKTQTPFKRIKAPTQTTIKENKTPTEANTKGDKTPTTIRVSKRAKNLIQTTIKGDKNPTQFRRIKASTPTTKKENKTPPQATTKGNKAQTQTTIKGDKTPAQTSIKACKGNKTPALTPTTAINGDKTTTHPTITEEEFPAAIKADKTSTQATRKECKVEESEIKAEIKADHTSTTQTTIKGNNAPTQATKEMDNNQPQTTIKKNNNSTDSSIGVENLLSEPTLKANETPTKSKNEENIPRAESTIYKNRIPTKGTSIDKNTPNISTIEKKHISIQSTINENKIQTEFSITEKNTPAKKTTSNVNHASTNSNKKQKITPNEYRIKENINACESTIRQNNPPSVYTQAENTPMESSVKEETFSPETILQKNNSQLESTITPNNNLSEFTIERSNTLTIDLPSGSTITECTIRSRNEKIQSSLNATTEDPILQETARGAEILLVKAGDVELNPGPLDRPADINEQELVNLAYDVPPSKYAEFCIALGITYTQSQVILTRHLMDIPGSLIEVFCEWRNRQRDGTNYRNVIAEALRVTNLDALGSKMIEGGYIPREPASTGSSVNGKEPLTREEVARCGDDFKTFYRTRMCKIKTVPLNFSSVLEFERIYTNLVLLRNEMGTTKKTPLDYTKLLTTTVSGELPKRLLVEGEVGAGKTTFCSKIAWDWTNGVQEFQQFDWVLLIPLREVDGNQTVGDIARTYLSDGNPVQPCQIDEYILANPSKVFIIFDGLDEYDGDLVKEENDIAKIIRSEKFRECRVLVTTRPWKADQIKSNTTIVRAFAFIAVTGFDEEHISIYINKYFGDDPQTGRELIRLIEINDVMKESVAPCPIYIAMLCVLWRESDSEKRKLFCRLKTFSQLFQEIITFLKDHYVSKQFTYLQKENLTQTRKNLDIYFTQIGQIALSGLMDKKLVFAKNDFSSCEVALETCFRVGVLSLEYQTVHELDRHKNVTHPVTATSVFFTHKLFQEYLAGVYLASLFESDPDSYKVKIDELFQKGVEEIRYLLYFTAAKTQMIALDITSRLMRISKNYEGYINILVDVTYEANDEDVAKAVGHNTFAQRNSLEISDQMSAHTLSGYLFIMEKQATIQKVFLEGLNVDSIDPTTSRDLASFLCLQPCLTDLTIRNTVYPPIYIHDDFYHEMAERAPHSKIQKVLLEGLDLASNDWTSARALGRFLCLQPCLTDLTIRNTGYPPIYLHDDFYHEIAKLASHSKIQKVLLEGLNLDSNDRTASRDLATFLCLQPCLTDLTIRNTDEVPVYVHDDFYEEIARMASDSRVQKVLLEGFDLESNDLTTSSNLAEFLCLQPCLTDLTIRNSGYPRLYFHGDFYRKIAELAPHSKIQKVLLEGLDLDANEPTASRDLARFLCLQPLLTDLTIRTTNDVPVYLHKDFYYEIARLAPKSKIQKVSLEHLNLKRNGPIASRDLARFLCLQPRLVDLKILWRTDDLPVYLHDDFYHEIALLTFDSKIQKLLLDGLNLERNDRTASRDLARFLCLQPCLTDLTIKRTDDVPVYLHDDFYHEIAHVARNSKIQKVWLEGFDLGRNDREASRDLARFLCLQPCLTDLTIRSTGYPPVYFHDDFYHEMAELAPHSKIQKVSLACFDLKNNDRKASRDLARFLCLQPCLTDLTIRNTLHQPVYVHDDFYHNIAEFARLSRIQKMLLEYFDPKTIDWNTSRYLARFLCLQPCLTDLTISDTHDQPLYLHDDFYQACLEVAHLAHDPAGNFFTNKLRSEELKQMDLTQKREYIEQLIHPVSSEITPRQSLRSPITPGSRQSTQGTQERLYVEIGDTNITPTPFSSYDLDLLSTSGIGLKSCKKAEAIDPSSATKPMHDVEEESQRDRIIRLAEHNITIHIPQHESHTMKEITVEALQSAPSELVLKKDEAIISMGLKFSPPGLQCNLPIKITMPHSAIFTHPKKASIFFCTHRNDADSYSAIPSSEYATPRCEVRQRDLDLYIDHFSDWWIIAKIRSFFYGKRLICTPYVPVLRPRNMKHCIYMCLTDDNNGPKESIKGYEAAFPTTEYFLQWGSGKLSITYFLDEQQVSSKSMEEREFYRLTNHRIPFVLKPGDSSPDVMVKFSLSQDITKDIMFPVTFDDVDHSTLSGSVQAENLGRNDPAGLGKDSQTKESRIPIKPGGKRRFNTDREHEECVLSVAEETRQINADQALIGESGIQSKRTRQSERKGKSIRNLQSGSGVMSDDTKYEFDKGKPTFGTKELNIKTNVSSESETIGDLTLMSNANTKVVDSRGDVIEVKEWGIEMTVPPGALTEPVKITVKALFDTPNLDMEPEEIIASCGFKCYPEGLHFHRPIRITLPHCAFFNQGTPITCNLYKCAEAEGLYKRIPLKQDSSPGFVITENTVSIDIEHFCRNWPAFTIESKRLTISPFEAKLSEDRRHIKLFFCNDVDNNLQELQRDEGSMGYRRKDTPSQFYVNRNAGNIEVKISIDPPAAVHPLEQGQHGKQVIQKREVLQKDLKKIWFTLHHASMQGRHPLVKLHIRQVAASEQNDCDEVTIEFPSFCSDQEAGSIRISGESNEQDFDDLLKTIAKSVSSDMEIDDLGKKLGFNPSEIDRYRRTNEKYLPLSYMGTVSMLRDWRNRTTRSEERKTLKKALIECNHRRLAEDLFKDDMTA